MSIQDIFIQLCSDNQLELANQLLNKLSIENSVILKTIQENHVRAFECMIQHFDKLDYAFHHQEPLRLACKLQRVPMIILLCRLPQVDPKIIDLSTVSDVVQFTLIRARYRRNVKDVELNVLHKMINQSDIDFIRIPIQGHKIDNLNI
jgi:hypothetical protein